MTSDQKWIENLEIEDAQIKWNFSHFAGEADTFNEQGDHNFVVMLDEEQAAKALADGWNVKEKEGYEEGDPPEYHLFVRISDKFGLPKVFFIRDKRKFRLDRMDDLGDIRRSTVTKMDIIIKPSRWVQPTRTGISAYVEEMYVHIKENRFSSIYDEMETI